MRILLTVGIIGAGCKCASSRGDRDGANSACFNILLDPDKLNTGRRLMYCATEEGRFNLTWVNPGLDSPIEVHDFWRVLACDYGRVDITQASREEISFLVLGEYQLAREGIIREHHCCALWSKGSCFEWVGGGDWVAPKSATTTTHVERMRRCHTHRFVDVGASVRDRVDLLAPVK